MQDRLDIVYAPTAARVARTMITGGAYLINDQDFFTWKSGIRAPVYTDCRALMGEPAAAALIKKALGSATLSEFGTPDYIVGVAEAGVYWSALVADELHTRHAFVRKTQKSHGIGGMVSGVPDQPRRVDGITAVVVDDLVASGGSLGKAIDALREEAHLEVLGVVSIVNWGFPAMRDRFRELKVPATSLVSYPQLLQAALDEGKIDEEFCAELLRFYRNPRGHQWSKRIHAIRRADRG